VRAAIPIFRGGPIGSFSKKFRHPRQAFSISTRKTLDEILFAPTPSLVSAAAYGQTCGNTLPNLRASATVIRGGRPGKTWWYFLK